MSDVADPNELLAALVVYARRGWRMFPLQPGKKIPFERSHGVLDATNNIDQLAAWWKAHPTANIGLALGPESALVLDVDRDELKGKHGDDDLSDAIATFGPLPDAPETLTPSGGVHKYFTHPDKPVVVRKFGDVDVQRAGLYVVLPPSRTDRGLYQWDAMFNLDTVAIPPLPQPWLDGITSIPVMPEHKPRPVTAGTSPNDAFDARTDFISLLIGDGAVVGHEMVGRPRAGASGGPYRSVWRPGKTHRQGSSARLWIGDGIRADVLIVFSSSWPGLPAEKAMTAAGYYAYTRHKGDFKAAAADLTRQGFGDPRPSGSEWLPTAKVKPLPPPPPPQEETAWTDDDDVDEAPIDTSESDAALMGMLVNWVDLYARELVAEDWLVQPLLPRGRSVSLYAPGGTGKSLLTLYVAAAIATGTSLFGCDVPERLNVLYLDYEMTDSDLVERMEALGYFDPHLLDNLHYALLPPLDPLDTPAGAAEVCRLAEKCHADLVVVDTFGRAVRGEENSADTVRDFYRLTGRELKAAGRTVLRIDHAGKDLEKGQRGTSAKRDDVDITWQMTAREAGAFELKATKRRVAWVPEKVILTRVEDDFGVLRFIQAPTDAASYPPGTKEVMNLLDNLNVPVEVTVAVARQLFNKAGGKAAQNVLGAAVRARKEARHSARNEVFNTTPGTTTVTHPFTPPEQGVTTPVMPRNDSATKSVTHPPSRMGGGDAGPACGPQEEHFQEPSKRLHPLLDPDDDGFLA